MIRDREGETPRKSRFFQHGARFALDEQYREPAFAPQGPNLSPEAPVLEGQKQVGGRLAFDQRPASNVVVSNRQQADLYVDFECPQCRGHSTSELIPVDANANVAHVVSITSRWARVQVSALAFSRREKA